MKKQKKNKGFSIICLGWIAITYIPEDIDILFGNIFNISEKNKS